VADPVDLEVVQCWDTSSLVVKVAEQRMGEYSYVVEIRRSGGEIAAGGSCSESSGPVRWWMLDNGGAAR
jgi:hypothetical protein